ncbi:hypothetical protein RB195_005412 [Necator americanus]|uniref:Calponin family repeat-containing domain protein n=1 Tax=Necator americanus TaxID=51031 RepID=A0ABR1BMP8_NECAM
MAAPQTAVAHEAGLKVAAVEVPSTDQNERRTRDGKWTLRQLRQTDAIVPLQSGTNQFDSQRGMTGFGTPRDSSIESTVSRSAQKKKKQSQIWRYALPSHFLIIIYVLFTSIC